MFPVRYTFENTDSGVLRDSASRANRGHVRTPCAPPHTQEIWQISISSLYQAYEGHFVAVLRSPPSTSRNDSKVWFAAHNQLVSLN